MQCCPFFVHIPSSYLAIALHQSSVHQYHASMSFEKQFLFLFLVGLTLQGKIKKEEGRG